MTKQGRPRCLTDEQVIYTIAQYKRGRSLPNLGREFGVSAATIGTYLKKAGIARRPRGGTMQVTPEITRMAAGLRDKGLSWWDIAQVIGFSETILKRHVRSLPEEEFA
jgi:lambda repressor-like predicted transcriptional regulator